MGEWMAQDNQGRPVWVHWDEPRCTGCMACVIVCSERHTGTSAPSRSRIHILVNPLTGGLTGSFCRQCRKAACAAACPQEAIRFDARLGAWLVDEHLCTGCGQCVEACRFRAIRLDPVTDLAAKCDLCQGAMRCVEVCPAGALVVKGRGGGR